MKKRPLIQARKQRGWTHKDVAERVGVPVKRVKGWEMGTKTPSIVERNTLCSLFQMDPNVLFPEQEKLHKLKFPKSKGNSSSSIIKVGRLRRSRRG